MSRRKKTSTFEDLYEIFLNLPWWIPLAVAGVVFPLFYYLLPHLCPSSRVGTISIDLATPLLHMLGYFLTALVFLAGLFSWVGKLRRFYMTGQGISSPSTRAMHRDTENQLFSVFMIMPAWLPAAIGGLAVCVIMYLLPAITYLSASPMSRITLVPIKSVASFVILLLSIMLSVNLYLAKNRRRQLLERQTGLDSIRQLSWKEFEVLVAEAFRRQGYHVIENIKGGADGGYDLMLKQGPESILVQCKHWKMSQVGVVPVRELYGVMAHENISRGIFVSSGSYTQEAMNFTHGKHLILLDGSQLFEMIRGIKPPTGRASSSPCRPAPLVVEFADDQPACPLCNSAMVLRTAKKGTNIGEEFWGCSRFPDCRGTRKR